MAIHFGNDKIKDIYVGSDKIKEVYYGSEKVWGKQPAVQDGYWVHKDTNAVTYFGADADFITDGIMNEPSWKLDCSEVQIPSGVTGLGVMCFQDCSSLTSINISEGVTSLGDYCFRYCRALTSVTLPEGVVSLGTGCFTICTSLTSISIPESITSLGVFCFNGCSSLILATVLPVIPPSLGWNAFGDVHSSFNIKVNSPYVDDYKTATNWRNYADKISAIPDGYWVHKDTGVKTYFGADADFITGGIMSTPSWAANCSEVQIPSGVIELWDECFFGCSDLISITLPESIIDLGESCFLGCSSLTSITLPEGITNLWDGCFLGCSSLISITLPESVTYIGVYCFSECEALTLATVLPAIPPSLGFGVFDFTPAEFNIKVRTPYVDDYKTATNWIAYADKISAI